MRGFWTFLFMGAVVIFGVALLSRYDQSAPSRDLPPAANVKPVSPPAPIQAFTEEESRAREEAKEAEERSRAAAAVDEIISKIEFDSPPRDYDPLAFTSSLGSMRRELRRLWQAYEFASGYKENTADLKISAAAKRVMSAVVAAQKRALPAFRKAACEQFRKLLWEENIDVKCRNANRDIEFIGGLFASNRNIAEAQKINLDWLTIFRFRRSIYRWIPDAEYTYYDMKPPGDEVMSKPD